MNVLSVRNLSKSFGGVQALRDVSFSVAPGEILAMIGPNGAGKTACFNVINGQLRPDAGSVFLGQRRIEGLPPRQLCRLGVGRTFQVAATFGSMSVRENLQVVERAPGEGRSVLAAVGIEALADHQCAALAYGDLKRVELAMALAARPNLLLMDEPTAGMAVAERQALMALVRRMSGQDGISVLFTEHDMDVVFAFADRVIVLDEGEVLTQGLPSEVRADERVRRVYLGEDAGHA